MGSELVPLRDAEDILLVSPTNAVCTYDRTTKEGFVGFQRAMRGKEAILKDQVGSVIEIQHIVAYWGRYSDSEDGEVREGPHVVFVSSDGRRIATTARSAVESALDPVRFAGRALPYDPPCKFLVCEGKTATPGHRYLYLEVVEW